MADSLNVYPSISQNNKGYEIKEIFGLSDSVLKLQDRSEQIIKQQQACPNRTMFTICRDITLKRETKKEKRN
ncbi:hypothetical protein T06_5638 [Trichinella sp. T6]|nr:hypothetical protein T06_11674 [Trichinella sp. T6]KRX84159.1 hypothetical protein T06_5638 [Trichinella sp. T6]